MEIFAWGLFSRFPRFCLLCENDPHAKIKLIWLYEGYRSSIAEMYPHVKCLANIFAKPPAKITTFNVCARGTVM